MEYRVAVRRVLGCAVVLLLAFTACNGGDDDTASPTTTAPSTTTTAPADPYAIPETIDVAYVQRVIDKLYEIEAEAAAEIVANKELVPSAAEKLRSIYEIDELNGELAEWSDIVADDFPGVREPPGAIAVAVEDLVAMSESCINARTTVDSRARFSDADPPTVYYTVLVPAPRLPPNPTPWVIRIQAAGGRSGEPLPYDPCLDAPQ